MKKTMMIFILSLVVVGGLYAQNSPPTAPTGLLCDGKTNPNNIINLTPELSWTFNDPNAGDTQSAYRILVSSSLAILS